MTSFTPAITSAIDIVHTYHRTLCGRLRCAERNVHLGALVIKMRLFAFVWLYSPRTNFLFLSNNRFSCSKLKSSFSKVDATVISIEMTKPVLFAMLYCVIRGFHSNSREPDRKKYEESLSWSCVSDDLTDTKECRLTWL